jgi:hypothetical protein
VRSADRTRLSVFKTKPFSRFARKAHLDDADLWRAAGLVQQGVIDADLGTGSSGSESLAREKGSPAVIVPYSFFAWKAESFSFMASRRRIEPTSGQMDWKASANWRM